MFTTMNTQPFIIHPGDPLPLGAWHKQQGINFAIASSEATAITLVLYDLEHEEPSWEIVLDPAQHKTGDVWHIFVELEISRTWGYGYKVQLGSSDELQSSRILLDPYARAVASTNQWGTSCQDGKDLYHPYGLIPPPEDFFWENDKPLGIPEKDLIIYEMHVRGFTQHSSSQVQSPGTFLGVIEKIPHLKDLGINAVEFLPLQEFNECEYQVSHAQSTFKLYQYWGYSSVNFFSPMNRYSFSAEPSAAIKEFKAMVKALHQNQIAVILDVVFNHTNEGNGDGPTLSYKGIDPSRYYLIDNEGKHLNFTGCGNTFNGNHPLALQLIIDALRYWVIEMHVDGFRFDLASIFYRGSGGEVLFLAPLMEAISNDPILANTVLIAEPWDAAGLYQVGSFYPQKNRWSEWNAHYRDTVRKFIKGTPHVKGKFASKISGSQDLYDNRCPTSSINFTVAHDGFTLRDLVSYNQKHNLANGENNRDGTNHNDSWNCGAEGETDDPEIRNLRERQMRNFHLALMISQGIPMLLMGDEYGHTKKGNNNTWCQDNELNWFLWDQLKPNADFYRFYKKMIHFRRQSPILRQGRFLTENDIHWWGTDGHPAGWDKDSQFLAFTLKGEGESNTSLYCAFNAQNAPLDITIPPLNEQTYWALTVNTANASPEDFFDEGKEPPLHTSFTMSPYSAILCLSKKKDP